MNSGREPWYSDYGRRLTFVDVEGTKEVKRMINLLAITVNLYHEIDADPSGSGSKPIGSGNNRC